MPAIPTLVVVEGTTMNVDRVPGRITGQIKTVLLLGALTAFVVGAGSLPAPSYAWLFAVGGVAMNIGSWFFSDRLVLRSSGARLLDAGGSAGAAPDGRRAGAGRRHPDAQALPDRRGPRQRLRHRPQPGARRRRRDARACCACCRAARSAASSRTRSRTSATATSPSPRSPPAWPPSSAASPTRVQFSALLRRVERRRRAGGSTIGAPALRAASPRSRAMRWSRWPSRARASTSPTPPRPG